MKDSERTPAQIEKDERILIERAITKSIIREREETVARINSYNRSLKNK